MCTMDFTYNDDLDRFELYMSEEDTRKEPVAAAVAETLFGEGLLTRVDGRGRAVDVDGQYTEGEWDHTREKYIPHEKKSDVDTRGPSTQEPSTQDGKSKSPSNEEPSTQDGKTKPPAVKK